MNRLDVQGKTNSDSDADADADANANAEHVKNRNRKHTVAKKWPRESPEWPNFVLKPKFNISDSQTHSFKVVQTQTVSEEDFAECRGMTVLGRNI